MRSLVMDRSAIRNLTGYRAIIASIAGACLTAACAKLAFYLPGLPVPVTMQVFAVLLCGMLFGKKVAALAQIEYIAAGLMGAPVFTLGTPLGFAALMGPTAGYMIGFVPAAYIVGYLSDMIIDRGSMRLMSLAGLAGVAVIYTFGAGWFAVWLQISPVKFAGWPAWAMAVAPFVGVDAVKTVAAAAICSRK